MEKKVLVIVLMVLVGTIWASASFVFGQITATNDLKGEQHRLEGRWVRPDGGYILELKNVGSKGDLKVTYFNPRPINVGISHWRKEEGNLIVFIVLRDINYQGSTYTLTHDPGSDRLKGKYFQAPTGMTYEVEFLRAK